MPESAFEQTIARAEGLLAFHRRLHGKQARPEKGLSDLLRGSLVLAVAGLDAHIVEVVCRAVPHLAGQGRLGADVAKWVEKNASGTIACFSSDNPQLALGDLARGHLGDLTFQRAKAIEGVLTGALGCEPPWEAAGKQLLTKGRPLAPDEVTSRLDEYVLRRHRIAHDGDLDPETGKTRRITLRWVEDGIKVIEAVGLAAEAVMIGHVGPPLRKRRRRTTPNPRKDGPSRKRAAAKRRSSVLELVELDAAEWEEIESTPLLDVDQTVSEDPNEIPTDPSGKRVSTGQRRPSSVNLK